MSKRHVTLSLAGITLLGLMAGSARAQTTFTNPNLITIVDNGVANPYPSTINVSGLTGTITNITVTIHQISHTYIADVGAVLVGPGGQKVVLFDGAGGDSVISNLTWTFDDDAAAAPLAGQGPLTSGTYKPNTYFPGDPYDPPGPGTSYGTQLSAFNSASPNGSYNLYVKDFVSGESGTISGGWSVKITTSGGGAAGAPGPDSLAVLAAPGLLGLGALMRRRRR